MEDDRDKRRARAEALEARLAELRHEAVKLMEDGLREKDAGAERETDALRRQVAELDARLRAIEASRAYRVVLAVHRVKRVADAAIGALSRTVIVLRKRARRRLALARPKTPGEPIVSVIMPVHNQGRNVLEALDSVRKQTLTSWELIVWDDGSTDAETIEILDQLDYPRVRVLESESRGLIVARNSAMKLARGEFVCCLSPDGLFSPTYFEKAVLLLDEHPDVAIAYPWIRCLSDGSHEWTVADLQPELIGHANHVPVCALMRREVIDATGGLNPMMAEGFEDWELWAHAAELGFRGRVIREHLFSYRHSSTDGRRASARAIHDELRQEIMRQHPMLLTPPGKPPMTGRGDAVVRLRHKMFALPQGEHRPIVFFVPWLTRGGGGERVVSDLTRGLVADGRTVVVMATHGCPVGLTDATEEMLRITPYAYDLTRFLDRETWLDFCKSIISRLGSPILINVGSTWLYHNIAELRRAEPGLTLVDQLFNQVGHVRKSVATGKGIDLTITAYHGLERLLVEHHRVASPVVTVPVGIDVPRNGVSPARTARSRPIVGWLGRLSVEKRPDWFLRLAAELGDRASFRLAGEGPLQAEVRRNAGRIQSLEVLGYIDDALAFIADCDVLVITSEIEGIPLVAMEAIALGTPVIATNVGGLPDLIEPGTNGYLASSDEPRELIARIRDLLDNPAELRRLQDAVAQAGLSAQFRTAAMIDCFRELLV